MSRRWYRRRSQPALPDPRPKVLVAHPFHARAESSCPREQLGRLNGLAGCCLLQARERLLTEAPPVASSSLAKLLMEACGDVLERQAGHGTRIAPKWCRPARLWRRDGLAQSQRFVGTPCQWIASVASQKCC